MLTVLASPIHLTVCFRQLEATDWWFSDNMQLCT